MTPQKFLEELLGSQNLTIKQKDDLASHKKEVTMYLQEKFGDIPKIKYAGSHEKGTMISDRYDLDIVCYFPSSDERSLKDIREDVAKHLSEKYLTRTKASAERILDLKGTTAPSDFHIDVVPGRFIEGSDDVFLHVAYGDKERMQTNLKTHISHIVNSGCVPVIRLVKLWAHRNNVQIKTFVLELFVVEALSGSRSKDNLQESFLKVLEAFKDSFRRTGLVDPANSNNKISQLMQAAEKTAIIGAAEATFNQIDSSDDLEDWQGAFCETGGAAKSSGAATAAYSATGSAYVSGGSFTPHKPWSDNHDNGN